MRPATGSSPKCAGRSQREKSPSPATASIPTVSMPRPQSRKARRVLLPAAGVAHYGGGRLMLALLERCVTDLGGTYAMEDTDSMAIVATQRGGLIECPGGPYRRNGKRAIRALSWAQVDAIAERFARLNPYDRSRDRQARSSRSKTTTSIPRPSKQRQLWCLAISAKRYALFVRDPTASRRCCATASITKMIGTPSTVSGICSILPIRKARTAAGSRRRGSASCADRWASPTKPLPL